MLSPGKLVTLTKLLKKNLKMLFMIWNGSRSNDSAFKLLRLVLCKGSESSMRIIFPQGSSNNFVLTMLVYKEVQ